MAPAVFHLLPPLEVKINNKSLSTCQDWMGGITNSHLSHESVLGLELLGVVHGIVDEAEASGLATTEVGLESKDKDSVSSAAVHLGQLLSDVSLGHGGLAGVEDVHNHLPPAEETVQHVLAGPDGHTAVNHGWRLFF